MLPILRVSVLKIPFALPIPYEIVHVHPFAWYVDDLALSYIICNEHPRSVSSH